MERGGSEGAACSAGLVVDAMSPAVVVLLIVVAIVGVLAIGSGSSRKVTPERQCRLSQKRINVVTH